MANPVGRPTKYDPAYCEAVIEHMRDGASLTSFAASIMVARSTINEWIDNHPEFSEAVKIGKAVCAAWWETVNRGLAMGEAGNATSCIFGLKNMAPDDWVDRKAIEHSGPEGGPIKTETRNQSIDDLVAEAKALGIDPSAFMDDGK